MERIISKAVFFPWLEKEGYTYYYNSKQHRFVVRGRGCYLLGIEMSNNRIAVSKQVLTGATI